MASPGMMQSGLSRELFESWCTDKRNGVIIAGYCVEGTLAKVSHSLRLLCCSWPELQRWQYPDRFFHWIVQVWFQKMRMEIGSRRCSQGWGINADPEWHDMIPRWLGGTISFRSIYLVLVKKKKNGKEAIWDKHMDTLIQCRKVLLMKSWRLCWGCLPDTLLIQSGWCQLKM